jgi:hypothetical protein
MSTLAIAGAAAGLALTLLTIGGIGVAVVRHLSRIEFSAAQAAASVGQLAATVAELTREQRAHGEELAVVKALLARETECAR